MIHMVRRVSENDSELTCLDFKDMCMPTPHAERRIAPELIKALAKNRYLKELSLCRSNLQGHEQAEELGRALSQNSTLEVLDIECNLLEPADLEAILRGVANNKTLRELRCADQICEQ